MNVTQVPQWHLEQCWDTPELNEWWIKTWMEGTVLHGNIQPGDLFSHGTSDRISVVCSRLTIYSAKEPPHFQYKIDHDTGGHFYNPTHERFIERGYFRFIPSAVQLASLGHYDWAHKLLDEHCLHNRCEHVTPDDGTRCVKCETWIIP